MTQQQELAKLISEIQAEGDVGAEDLAQALINAGVQLSGKPVSRNEAVESERIEQMVKYALSVLRHAPQGSLNRVTETFMQAKPEVQDAFAAALRQRLHDNRYFYLGMQTTGEMVRAVGDVPELATAYGQMTPEERSRWVSSLRDAWYAFSQAAAALGKSVK